MKKTMSILLAIALMLPICGVAAAGEPLVQEQAGNMIYEVPSDWRKEVEDNAVKYYPLEDSEEFILVKYDECGEYDESGNHNLLESALEAFPESPGILHFEYDGLGPPKEYTVAEIRYFTYIGDDYFRVYGHMSAYEGDIYTFVMYEYSDSSSIDMLKSFSEVVQSIERTG